MILRRLVATVLLTVVLIQPETVITQYNQKSSEDYLWEILLEEAPNEYVAAGILGYFWRESKYRSDAIPNWPRVQAASEYDPCAAMTEQLDAADKEEFVALVQQTGGYGLGQWYDESYLESLYDFCRGAGASVADARMQCRFTVHICTTTPRIWDTLKDATSALEAGRIIGCLHDGSPRGAETIAAKADAIYQERCG